MDTLATAEPPHFHHRNTSRKLLQTSSLTPATESDPSKAVVLYRPPSLPLSLPGRSLSGTSQMEVPPKPSKVTVAGVSTNKTSTAALQKLGLILLLLLLCVSLTIRFKISARCDDRTAVLNDTSVFTLNTKLFGQDIAKYVLLNRIGDFLRNNDSLLALVLIGGPGTGKSFTTGSAFNNLDPGIPKKKILLPLSTKESLRDIHMNHESCSGLRMLFIEDVDSGELWQMQLLIEYLNKLQKPQAGFKTIVLLNSSAGQKVLTRLLYDKLENNQLRSSVGPEVLQLLPEAVHSVFLDLLQQANIRMSFVPFFPLEKSHVRQCIERDLEAKHVLPAPELVEKVLSLVRFHPADSQYFAVFGCKNVHTYVNIVLSDVNS